MINTECTPIQPAAEPFFDQQLLQTLDPVRIPKHVAIIPDGNRRWARKFQENVPSGHRQGADNLLEIFKAAKSLGIKVLTIYTFSTENWSRSEEEIRVLMWMLQSYLAQQCPIMLQEHVRFTAIGDLSRLPAEVLASVKATEEATRSCDQMTVVLAINYGGRDDIRRAMQKIAQECLDKKICPQQITEDLIASYLDTSPWGDPDLLIRAGGEMRISNFLLWQLSYSEIYITDALWPDFTPNNLLEAVIDFQKRERRLGGQ